MWKCEENQSNRKQSESKACWCWHLLSGTEYHKHAVLPSSPLFVLLCGLGASLAEIPSASLDFVGCHLLHSVTVGINGQGWDGKTKALPHYPSLLIYSLLLILTHHLASPQSDKCVYASVPLYVFFQHHHLRRRKVDSSADAALDLPALKRATAVWRENAISGLN